MLISKLQKYSIIISSMVFMLFFVLMVLLLSNPLCYENKYERKGTFNNSSVMEITFSEGRIFEVGRQDNKIKYQYFYYINSDNEIYGISTTSTYSTYNLQAKKVNKFTVTTTEWKYDHETSTNDEVVVEYICHSGIRKLVFYVIAMLITIGVDVGIIVSVKKKNRNYNDTIVINQ